MLICPRCNHQVPDDAKFCEYCGVNFLPIEDEETTSPAQATTVLTSDMQYAYYGAQNQTQQDDGQSSQPQYQASVNNANEETGRPNGNSEFAANANGGYAQMPMAQLKTDRSFIKTILLSLITFGIYAIVTYGHITDDVNLVCSRYDGKKSMNYYLLMFIVSPLTFGIASIVWQHNICNRIGNELQRRQVMYSFSASDFWLWGVLGSFILIGPFVFCHKFFTAVNKMNESFNQNG